VLQKHIHCRRGLHEREELEAAQATELTYLGSRGADKADWVSSKIMMDLGRVEVLETTTRGNSLNDHNGTSRDASIEVLVLLVAVFQHMEGLLW